MKVIVSVDNSAGNESAGEMWQDAYIFEHTNTLLDVFNKLAKKGVVIKRPDELFYPTNKNIRLTIPYEYQDE